MTTSDAEMHRRIGPPHEMKCYISSTLGLGLKEKWYECSCGAKFTAIPTRAEYLDVSQKLHETSFQKLSR